VRLRPRAVHPHAVAVSSVLTHKNF
jgi:hypothetical protein